MFSLFLSLHFTRDLLALGDVLLFSSFYSLVAFQLFPHSSLGITNKRKTLIDKPLTLASTFRRLRSPNSEQKHEQIIDTRGSQYKSVITTVPAFKTSLFSEQSASPGACSITIDFFYSFTIPLRQFLKNALK
jgi:hypothetical protein